MIPQSPLSSVGKISSDSIIAAKNYISKYNYKLNREIIVLKKENTGLDYNIEILPDNSKRLRYDHNCDSGAYKSMSRQIDIDTGTRWVKLKMFLDDPSQYKNGKYKCKVSKMERIQSEIFGSGLVDGSVRLQNLQSYTKGGVRRVAVYCKEIVGGTLESNIKKLTPKQKLQSLIGICRFVASLHKLGFAHSDIKPNNILLNESFTEVHAIDFAFIICKHERPRGGSLLYMPCGYTSETAETVDCHALGMTVYQVAKSLNKHQIERLCPNAAAPARDQIFSASPQPETLEIVAYRLLDPNERTRYTAEKALLHLKSLS